MARALKDELLWQMRELGRSAREATSVLASATTEQKDEALRAAADAMTASMDDILTANRKDVEAGRINSLSAAMIDRLTLTPQRVDAMANGLRAIADLDDPVGQEIARWKRPNGLDIARVRTPLGVVGVIYESRPNVTVDAGGLCLKSGNAAILRGGSDSYHSSGAILLALHEGLHAAGLPETAIQAVPTRDRDAVGIMLTMHEWIDVIVPRGGRSLTERVQNEAKMPVFAHLDGICHTYLHKSADPKMAADIALNAKMRRTGICGATETLLVDREAALALLPGVIEKLIDAGCELRGDASTQAMDARINSADDADWGCEYLDAILSIRQVNGLDEAIDHIERYSSHHTEAIIAEDADAAATFLNRVDSAIVIHNASTQFADGGEFGMGAEIGISTGRMHARGPVGVEQLTTFKYLVRGQGQCRPT